MDDDGREGTVVNDPQIWTLIGVFAASTFAMVTLVSTMFVRVLDAKIGALDTKIDTKIDALDTKIDTKIDALDAKIDSLEARLDARIDTLQAKMEAKFDALDRDISAIARRVFPDEP